MLPCLNFCVLVISKTQQPDHMVAYMAYDGLYTMHARTLQLNHMVACDPCRPGFMIADSDFVGEATPGGMISDGDFISESEASPSAELTFGGRHGPRYVSAQDFTAAAHKGQTQDGSRITIAHIPRGSAVQLTAMAPGGQVVTVSAAATSSQEGAVNLSAQTYHAARPR